MPGSGLHADTWPEADKDFAAQDWLSREHALDAGESDAESNQDSFLARADESCTSQEEAAQLSCQVECESEDGCVSEEFVDSYSQSNGKGTNEEQQLPTSLDAGPLSLMAEDISWQNCLVYVMLVYCLLFIRYEI